MDKIQEEFDKWINKNLRYHNTLDIFSGGYKTGFKAADLLPTEKVCPDCGGKGEIVTADRSTYPPIEEFMKCFNPHCKNGTIPVYYTPEQYKEITGKDFPNDGMVWVDNPLDNKWSPFPYNKMKTTNSYLMQLNTDQWQFACYIVQTAQPTPSADYRPEE